jgi:SAM domain (Sterile alpha motif)
VHDVAAWLERLGLGRYAKTFQDNEIDFETLPLLTEAWLEQMGLPIGPRVKLLAAIANLVPSPVAAAAVGQREAENRQLTIMFCDLVDSTKLATRLDPEDLRGCHAGLSKGLQDRHRAL